MGNLRMELEKLINYTSGRDVVTAADIEAVCVTRTQNKIFDMVQAVTDKNQEKALDLYYDLLTLKEPPMRILFLLAKAVPAAFSSKTICTGRAGTGRNGFPPWCPGLCCPEDPCLRPVPIPWMSFNRQ